MPPARRTESTQRLAGLVAGLLFFAAACALGNQPAAPVDEELRHYLKTAIETSDSFVDRFDAEVWLLSKQEPMGRFFDDPQQRMDMLRRIHRAASSAGLQPEVVLAVIEVESRFDRFAVSSAGAQGMMQVMPFWKNEIGHPDDNLTDIDTNLRYGCAILKHYLNKANGRLMDALARYNGSYGQYWYPRRVMNAWQDNWR
ncbi:MAG: lytic transglycosylase domain-containing protein [Gammaproteobacteria bacterium]|uniref:lytic transglycosylase domain-containing protein n=1 Tax=Pseudomaricurvus alcaniphilus TaxID=1166482 RepID=UPI00140C9FED|nr:lytic transglycosylase domain-containing protein [Pseudomaricurvus alcaniphilus]MBR9908881.1 lytic transglycosylase domain-containing protein [Gammaproteobacteria bacterium]NHN37934.1 lytic transglycosylase domain-containing protein [Pseudomaricurvus alcaniphilus]